MIIDAEQIWSEVYRATIVAGMPPMMAKESTDEALRVWKERVEEIRKESREKYYDLLGGSK